MPKTPKNSPRFALFTTTALASVLLAGCGGSAASSGAAKSPTLPVTTLTHNGLARTAPTPATTPSSSSVSELAQSATIDSTAWLAGFKVQVTGARLDPTTATISVDALLTNTSQIDRAFSNLSAEISLDPGDDSGLLPIRSTRPSGAVVAGTSARTTLVFEAGDGASLDAAVLVLGQTANHQWRVPLQTGGTAIGESPVSLTSPGRITTAGNVYLDIASAQLVPWSCSGITPYTAFVPYAKSTSIVAIRGVGGAGAVPSSGSGIESMSIAAPDGTTAAVVTPPLKVWSSNQSTADLLLCLPVPVHLSGTYVLTITDSQRHSATATIAIP